MLSRHFRFVPRGKVAMRRSAGLVSSSRLKRKSESSPLEQWYRRLSTLPASPESAECSSSSGASDTIPGEAAWGQFLLHSRQCAPGNETGLECPAFLHTTSNSAAQVAKLGCRSVQSRVAAADESGSSWKQLCEDRYGGRPKSLPSNRRTLHRLLKGCIADEDLVLGSRLHALLVAGGRQLDGVTASLLIRMYAAVGSLVEANRVFCSLAGPDAAVWAAIISAHVELGQGAQAIRLYKQVDRSAVKASDHLFVAGLKACGAVVDLASGRLIHAHVLDCGFQFNAFVGSSLVDMYAKCGSLEDARRVFDGLPIRDVVTWSAMLAGYAQHGFGEEALGLYAGMQQDGAVPDNFTFVSILKACGSTGAVEEGKKVHAEILERGLEADVFVGSSLVDMYVKWGSLEDACRVFDTLLSRNVVTWNAMIGGYARQGHLQEALDLLARMEQDGAGPADDVTFSSLLRACASDGAIQEGRRIHADILKRGLDAALCVGSSLVDMYAKCGSMDEARLVFERLPAKNVVTWNALINGYGQQNDCSTAMKCFEEMLASGVDPDAATFTCLLVACSHVGLVHAGERYLKMMEQEHGISPGIEHFTCMVDLLGRSGQLDEAQRLLLSMPFEAHSVGWRSLLSACKSYGNVEQGRLCFNRLVELEPQQAAGYVLMSDMYSDAGRWEDAEEIENLRRCAGVVNMPAKAVIEVNNMVHQFVVGEMRDDISSKLRSLNVLEEEELPHTELRSRDKEDEGALCGHAEKLALAFGLLNTPQGADLLVIKNLRMCLHCHDGTKIISRMEKREITVRDAHRVHHFKDGLCSCGDHR